MGQHLGPKTGLGIFSKPESSILKPKTGLSVPRPVLGLFINRTLVLNCPLCRNVRCRNVLVSNRPRTPGNSYASKVIIGEHGSNLYKQLAS